MNKTTKPIASAVGEMVEASQREVETIRQNLKAVLTDQGLSAEALTGQGGGDPRTIRNFLDGKNSQIENVARMCHAAGFSLSEMAKPAPQPKRRTTAALKRR